MLQLPKDFIEKYKKLLENEAQSFFDSLNEDTQKAFRINSLKLNYKDISMSLGEPIPFINNGYYGQIHGKSLEHQSGYVYSQDVSAMYVGQVVNAKPGEFILDLCAAPGGKSTHIAQQLNNEGLLVSNEINHKRAEILVENLERFGAKNVIILNESPENISQNFPPIFDKIIVDAPCSGEGMFRKNHDAIKYWHKDYPNECSVRQKNILSDVIKVLKPGGELIYSTCTFAPEEDEQVVQWILDNYRTLRLANIEKCDGMDAGRPDFANGNPELVKCVRLMPHHFKGEGQFIAKFESTEPQKVIKKKKRKRNKQNNFQLNKTEFELWRQFIKPFSDDLANQNIDNFKVFNNHLYFYKNDWPDISKLKFMRPGLYLGEFKKKRFEPSYALALTLNPEHTNKKIEFTNDQWAKYLRGETVNIDVQVMNGWYLLTCNQKAFSFGKVVNGIVKNFIPKKIRFK